MRSLPPFLTDWFTGQIPIWEKHLASYKGKPTLRFLEIGTWEGKSACWLLEHILTHESARLMCIDPFPVIDNVSIRKYASVWGLTDPYPEHIDIEQRFDANIAVIGAAHKVIKHKGVSQEILRKLSLHSFDMIYIDGSHFPADAMRDIVLSWDLLNEEGIMIMDDYLLNESYKMGNPKPAIDGFLSAFKGQYELLHSEWQVIVKKTTHDPRVTDHPAVGVPWNIPKHTPYPISANETKSIISITVARNEEDILESFVQHNAAIVDKMIIVLHCCSDASREILERLIRRGLPLEMRESDAPYHAQSKSLTAIIRELSESSYRWILPLDADECLCDTTGNPRAVLQKLKADIVYDIPWKTYVPTPKDDFYEKNPLMRIRYHRVKESPQFTKVLIPGHLTHQAVILLGSHTLIKLSGDRYESRVHPTLYLAHFPVRSEQQLRRKIIHGWESHLSNPDRKPNEIFQWEMLYSRCQDPTPISPQELQDIALWYAVPLDKRNTVNKIVYDPVTDVCSKPALHSHSSSLVPPGT